MSTIDSEEVREIAKGEIELYSAWFGRSLNGDTLSSVVSVAQTSGASTLTVGSGAINTSGAVTVDGKSRDQSTVVQYTLTVPSDATAGEYEVTVTADTSAGRRRKLRCQLRVV